MSVCVHIFMHEHTGPFPPMNSVHGRREGFWRREFCLESPRMLHLLPPGRVSVLAALFLRAFSPEDITSQPFVSHFQLVDGLISGPSRNY